ncbi:MULTISPECIES: DUF2795 domain-containing protein [unclassified Streptomyces]|uniref:DUF2795 domain-containing protein n=1 Tax=unclassified Streptomyces TaxID=2593676 RepID=UPI001F04A66B|nr:MULTISPECIES: DUF2795 domain-containing protein [unclassified Streptomyces]MCH0563434.1 DUF2795 domain-containing protein [Streptomyces sp. MUM 2J]MCH0571458.1 DUF2795 domain-containing protein [Streptomyces sp. MUM 136J]
MQRGSDRMSVYRDEERKHELQGLLRSGHPTRLEEWQDPEPAAEDDPQVWGGSVAPGGGAASLETVRLELARILGRGAFPADAAQLAGVLHRRNAPDALVDALRTLPRRERYGNVQELAEAVTGTARHGGR